MSRNYFFAVMIAADITSDGDRRGTPDVKHNSRLYGCSQATGSREKTEGDPVKINFSFAACPVNRGGSVDLTAAIKGIRRGFFSILNRRPAGRHQYGMMAFVPL